MAGNGSAAVMVGSVNMAPHYKDLLAAMINEDADSDKVRPFLCRAKPPNLLLALHNRPLVSPPTCVLVLVATLITIPTRLTPPF
jgi:hypothetical protein